jgi:hypothetical protein
LLIVLFNISNTLDVGITHCLQRNVREFKDDVPLLVRGFLSIASSHFYLVRVTEPPLESYKRTG